MSFRKQQIESLLKRTISQVLSRKISDPRITGLVSITHVDVSPELAQAQVFITVIPEKYEKRTLAGLRHANGHIHRLVSDAVALKTTPRFEFRLDESLKKEAAVFAAIKRGLKDEAPTVPADDDAAETDSDSTKPSEDQEP